MNQEVQQVKGHQVDIMLSDTAQKHILSFLAKQEGSQGVRFSVKKTGCSGLSYVVDYVLTPQETDLTFPLSNTYQLYIDKSSYLFLKGMQVDYVKQGLNYKFVFTNPNQTGQCGCGESFTVNDF